MGFDTLKAGETHEVTIRLSGPCDEAEAKKYKAALKKCWKMLRGYGAKRGRRIVIIRKRETSR